MNTYEGDMRRRVEKPWGYELIFARTAKYVGKILFIKKGHRLSLQYHEHKDETIYVQSGELTVQLEGADGKLVSMQFSGGESVRIEPLKRHRMQAITDTTLFEVSTPELDDVKRVEDDYGRAQ